MTWIWWAPLAAAALHIVEEFVCPGGFAAWDRAYRPAISASITPRFHVIINGLLLLLCAQVWGLAPLDRTGERAVAGVAWLAVAAVLFSNAVFHVIGSVRTRSMTMINRLNTMEPMKASICSTPRRFSVPPAIARACTRMFQNSRQAPKPNIAISGKATSKS